jgi:hypothetical protein
VVEVPPGGERSARESGAQSAARDEAAPSLEPIEEAEEEEDMDAEQSLQKKKIFLPPAMADPITFVARFAKLFPSPGWTRSTWRPHVLRPVP